MADGQTSKLRQGTYVREPDGATLVYYSPLTTWNFPQIALKQFQNGRYPSSLNQWEHVTDEQELQQLGQYFNGPFKPGEYGVVIH
jgi:hypothetical protein